MSIKKKRKICVVINSRPNYSRIKSFLKAAKENKNIDLDILVGASALLYRFGEFVKII
jgi:UDP-N-acetylglucosamine 2-epimerase